MFKKIMIVMFTFSLMGLLSGCEGTLKGMGEDIEKMGKSLQDTVGSDKKPEKDADPKK